MVSREPTIHRIGNRSDVDMFGRLVRFRVSTLCGLSLSPPMRLTDVAKVVTCRRCLKGMAIWSPRASARTSTR